MRQFAMGAIFTPGASNVSPIPIAILHDATVDFKVAKKFLRGQFKVPIDAGEGPVDIDIKIKSADFRAATIGMVLSNLGTVGAGSTQGVFGEAQTIPATPFAVTVTNSGTFAEDGGVLDLTTGLWMTRKADATAHGSLATGQYALTTPTSGVYTFADVDTTHKLSIVYSFTSGSIGQKANYANVVMGPSTGYKVRLYNTYKVNGVIQPLGFDFYNCHFDNMSFNFKAEDWSEQDLTGKAIQDTASLSVFDTYIGN